MENANIEGKETTIKVDSDFFPLNIVYSAAYVLLDKAYFMFDGDPDEEIEVHIRAKDDEDPEEIANVFHNELVNHSVYSERAERNKEVREAIIKRALGTNLEGDFKNLKEVKDYLSPKKEDEKR